MSSKKTNAPLFIMAVFMAASIIFYVFVYQISPFPEPWNDMALNGTLSLSAIITTIIALMVFFSYEKEDAPRSIWLSLSEGIFCWALAEITWTITAFQTPEVPTPSLADAFWVFGFIFYSIGLLQQYTILYPENKQKIQIGAALIWALSLFTPIIFINFTSLPITVESYINYWYPFMDFAIAAGGLYLAITFRGGAMMRPWIGMLVFSISDLMYAWAVQTGIYDWSSETGNSLTLIVDTTYLAAYLILAFGFLGQWLLIRYGPNK
jgi:hypothetical protein